MTSARKVVVYEFMCLDGVAEDVARFFTESDDEEGDAVGAAVIATQDAVILGRRTYDEWAPFWPGSDIEPFATFINTVPKYVATSTPLEHEWANASAIEGGLVDFVRDLKSRPGGDIGVHASISVAQALLSAGVVDELRLVIAPANRRRSHPTSTYRMHTKETTMTAMFVNLPVSDLERSKAFYTAIGFTLNPAFTDHNAACVIVEEGHSHFMLLLREFFQTVTERPIADPATTVLTATAIFVESREAVDTALVAGLAAGGSEAQAAADYGFMYQRQLTDPDGHLLEFGYMDPVAAEQGPEAFMSQQA